MTAVIAILVDSYRELIAKKLFWFVLAISLLIVISFGSIGFNARGVSIGYGLHTFDSETLHAGSPFVKPFMDTIFSSFIVHIWLTWGATILALVSTAEIFPTLLAGGSIDLVLSKPIRRTTVFLTKYVGSLFFVLLQVTVFSIGVLIALRFRLDEWRWPVLYAIPLVVLVFSFLFSIMVLFNVITRSTLASLLLTMITWVGLFTLHTTSDMMAMFMVIRPEIEHDRLVSRVERYNHQIVKSTEAGDDERTESLMLKRAGEQSDLEANDVKLDRGRQIHQAAQLTVYLLPKTSATTDLLSRRLSRDTGWTPNDLMEAVSGGTPHARPRREGLQAESGGINDPLWQQEANRRMEKMQMSQTPTFIIGSSLTFEVLVLGLAVLIFNRREW